MLLNLHSRYSLRYGTLSIEQLIKGMQYYGHTTGVLTDINNSTAIIPFEKACKAAGINSLAVVEFRNGSDLLYVGIAKNMEGFKELNELLTEANKTKQALPKTAPEWENVFVIYPYKSGATSSLRPNEFIGVRYSQMNQLIMDSPQDRERYVICQSVSFKRKEHQLHKQLRAIHHNVLISQLEEDQYASADEVFVSKEDLWLACQNYPEIWKNTERLVSDCSFDFDFKSPKNKQTFTGNSYDDKQLLYKYAMDGLARRYGAQDKEAKARLLKELEVIHTLNFSSYFLITDDICRYARGRNFHYVGRGSGANSIVAYCLGITNVCPIKLNLYFERFLNPKRRNPPDFDIDFSWKDRDEMFDYIFKRYQNKHTALMGAISTFKDRSIIRELGKIYGLPKTEIDRLILQPGNTLNENEITKQVLNTAKKLANFPNQRTIHASGVLISENPLTYYSALDYPPKGLPTVQYDMYVAEDMGFEKFDILSQRGIGHIKDCREIILQNRGEVVDTSHPRKFFKDPKISEQLKNANTVGCFYIESPAMRQLLRKLRCDNYLTLVAASSIIRPGVASSGMMHTYIERHRNPEKVSYLHPVFKEHLEETYGVMVYQEDVMKIGHHFGGLDLADADVLRRMMSGKYRSKKHLDEIHDKFFDHCKASGYPEDISKEIWRQMESFAGYSFNKAHSASFAMESYQSLYLKTYFPLEFMVAVLNNYGGYYSREVYINEAKRAGGEVRLPCVNHSFYHTHIEGETIYLGFDCLLHVESKLAYRIPSEREENGLYTDIESFHKRTHAGLEQIVLLIRSGAFSFLKKDKKTLLWEAHILLQKRRDSLQDVPMLFENTKIKMNLPKVETSLLEDLYDEIELLGFPVSGSMFDFAKSDYRGEVVAGNLAEHVNQKVRVAAYLATWKTVRTKNHKIMKFGTFLDVHGDFIETVHFPQNLFRYPLRGNGLYLIEGKVVLDFDFPTIEVYRCAKMPLKPDPRSV